MGRRQQDHDRFQGERDGAGRVCPRCDCDAACVGGCRSSGRRGKESDAHTLHHSVSGATPFFLSCSGAYYLS